MQELRDDLVPAAKAWIEEHAGDPEAATQPWDREGYRMPGGTPSTSRAGRRRRMTATGPTPARPAPQTNS